MIVFKPSGAVYIKENLCSCELYKWRCVSIYLREGCYNLCSCEQCINGDVLACPQEKGVIICNADNE